MHAKPRHLLVLILVPSVAAVIYAAAAALGTTSTTLQSGNAAVAACQSNGFTFAHTIVGGNVTEVTVGGISAACQGSSLALNLTNGSRTSIGSGTAAVPAGCSNCSVPVPVSPQPAATSVVADALGVTGP